MRRPPDVSRQPRALPRDLLWAAVFTVIGAVTLWKTWPTFRPFASQTSPVIVQREACLSNLEQIAHGFALYASDWDGKFPRGKDAEDRASPQIWQQTRRDGRNLYNDVLNTPMLPDLLQNYRVPRAAWHCPADVGWDTPRLPGFGPATLRNVHPSAWQKFGMSYFYLTEYGLRGIRASELGERADRTLLLFDGDFWHPDEQDGPPRAGALLADGEVRTFSTTEFSTLLNGS